MKVTLDHIEKISHNVTTFWFKPRGYVDYTAGQFIEMYLPHDSPDERGHKHWFTLSSSPTEDLLSITTKFAGDKGSSFKRTLFALKPGVVVDMSDPMGDFVLPKDKTIPLVFVAGGIGVTPYRSITKWLMDTKEQRDIQAVLAAATPKDVLFKDLFEAYAVKPSLVFGQLKAEQILTLIASANDKRIYVSGPEQMVETLHKDLEKLGVSKDQLVGDFFPGYSAI